MKVATRNKRIIAALKNGATVAAVAAEYGVTSSNVYRIRSIYNRAHREENLRKPFYSFKDILVGESYSPVALPAPVVVTPPTNVNTIQVGGDHYKQQDIQPWDAIHAWGLGYFSGNVVKYVARHQIKGGVQDLKKAQHYLTKLIEIMEASE